jgi:hypothetical protein
VRRTLGWEYVHVCVADYSRLAYAEVLADQKASTAAGFLRRAVAFTVATASTSSRSSPTTAPPTSRPCTRSAAAHSASDTPTPDHAGPRRKRESRTLHPHPHRENGPTAPIRLKHRNAAIGHHPRSPDPTCSGPTPSALQGAMLVAVSCWPPPARAETGKRAVMDAGSARPPTVQISIRPRRGGDPLSYHISWSAHVWNAFQRAQHNPQMNDGSPTRVGALA